ncbi:MAG: o-succinylbenzoate synthase [Bacteroidales bacterium]|nr:o-succinylbenzoate synthase [Bacteroidales bacterium]
MLKSTYCRYFLAFNEPATTSRETMRVKETYFVKLWDTKNPGVYGVGECGLFRGLSAEDTPDYEATLAATCRYIHTVDLATIPVSSIAMGFETALRDLQNGGTRMLWDSPFARGEQAITINGLIWMGDRDIMAERIEAKLKAGFRCLKLKIGGIKFDEEVSLLELIRSRFTPEQLEIRLDANESFDPREAAVKLERLAQFSIHSIEQPIKRGLLKEMRALTKAGIIPIALDEQLIGVTDSDTKRRILDKIHPSYIILKPTLCGGFTQADDWIAAAEDQGIGWWATSALESNIGLNAIAQWVAPKLASAWAGRLLDGPHASAPMPQGLGTGQLYRNNIPSPLRLASDGLSIDSSFNWDLKPIIWQR